MAPIDPNQLLQAFAPLLTPSGGIKNANEVPRLSSLMKKFSRKLVSRCVYCNVLLATTPDVLEEFLRSGGWETIHLWIKSAKELGNKPFLDELLTLLLKLPMNVERLRENDSPKIIRKIAKQSDDPILAAKAKEVVDKWTKMIELASGLKEKGKRKSNESTNNVSKDTTIGGGSDPKKSKLNAKSLNNAIDYNSADSNSSAPLDALAADGLKLKAERTPRPSTAKVKPGKSRLGDLVSCGQTGPKLAKSRKESDKKSSTASNKVSNNANAEPLSSVTTTPAVSLPKPKALPVGGIKLIEPLSVAVPPTPPVPAPVVAPPPKPHVLQDSMSFMDALIAPTVSTTTKKKPRRTSSSTAGKEMPKEPSIIDTTTASASTTSPKASPPKPFSFYMDIIDEKVDNKVNESNNNSSEDNDAMDDEYKSDEQNDSVDDNEEEMNHMSVDITVPDIKVDTTLTFNASLSVISKNKNNTIKPILCYVKKGVKKSVRWVDESGKRSIQAVKYFELDETERENVNRPAGSGGINDMKRYDMRHEAELMHHLKRGLSGSYDLSDLTDQNSSRSSSFGSWRLIPCDGDANLIEHGKDSKERAIQADRIRTTLQTFFTASQMPDSPQEPDAETYLETDVSKVIPLEDDNNPNNIHDYSNIDLPQPKTGEKLPPRMPDFQSTQPPMNNFGGMPAPNQYPGGGPPMGGPGPNFGGGVQQMIPPFGSQPLLPPPDQFGVPMPSGPPQQFYPPNNGPPPPFQQWPDGPPGPPPGHMPPHRGGGPSPPQFGPPFQSRGMGGRGGPPPRLPRNAQNTVCRHFSRTGKCRFQPKCNFLHTKDR